MFSPGSWLVLLVCVACGGAKKQTDIATSGTSSAAELGSHPLARAQPIGDGTRMLIQLQEGASSPSRLVDIPARSMKIVAPGPADLVASEGDFATIRTTALQRLSLSTGAVVPVSPAEAGPGLSRAGVYVYLTATGDLAILPPGGVSAMTVPQGSYAVERIADVQRISTGAFNGWLDITVLSAGAPLLIHRIVNAEKKMAGPEGTQIFFGKTAAFLVQQGSAGQADIVRFDPISGTVTAVSTGVFAQAINLTPDRLALWFPANMTSAGADWDLLDLVTGNVTHIATNATIPLGSGFLGEQFQPAQGVLFLSGVSPSSTYTLLRLDRRTVTEICTGTISVVARDGQVPNGILCFTGTTLSAYDWGTESLTVLTTSHVSSSVAAPDVFWWEGSEIRALRLGSGGASVTVCSSARPWDFAGQNTISADGHVAVVACTDAENTTSVLAIDLTNGRTQSVLSPAPFLTSDMVISPTGRIVAVDHASGTLFYDLTAGLGADSPEPASLHFQHFRATRGDGVVSLDSAIHSTSVLAFPRTSAAPEFRTVNTPFRTLYGTGANGRFVFGADEIRGSLSIADSTTGTFQLVSSYDFHDPPRIGASNDFLSGQGIVHLDSGELESLGSGWATVCDFDFDSTQSSFSFVDSSGTLRRYEPGVGTRTIARSMHLFDIRGCSPQLLFLSDFDGRTGTLEGYDLRTGTLTTAASRMSSVVAIVGDRKFGFQNADSDVGDLVLLDADKKTLTPLGARAPLDVSMQVSDLRVAFVQGSGATAKLVAANLDGSGARTIGSSPSSFKFSPDGSHLLFLSESQLWIENPSGAAIPLGRDVTSWYTDRTGTHVLYSTSNATFLVNMQ